MLSLKEVAEVDAVGRVATIYRDIRQTLRVPLVNLIYRHLACDEPVLDQAWSRIKPALISGEIFDLSSQLRAAVFEMAKGGFGASNSVLDMPDVHNLLQVYNVGNSVNIISMNFLFTASDQVNVRSAQRQASDDPFSDLSAVPPIPALSSFDANTRRRLCKLNRFGNSSAQSVAVSLYRHLAIWPHALDVAERVLSPLDEQGVLENLRHEAADMAKKLVSEKYGVSPIRDPLLETYRTTIEQFTLWTIPTMLPIGIGLAPYFGHKR